jgi:hypothetical protein
MSICIDGFDSASCADSCLLHSKVYVLAADLPALPPHHCFMHNKGFRVQVIAALSRIEGNHKP